MFTIAVIPTKGKPGDEHGHGLYATLDGTAGFGTGATAELLAGAKVATASIGTLGIGYRFPGTRSRSFDRQVLLQLEIGKH